MSIFKRVSSALLCVAAAVPLTVTAAFAEGNTVTEVTIDAYSVIGGYSGDNGKDLYSTSYPVRIGGGSDVFKDISGASAIAEWYNNSDKTGDTKVSFVRVTLPEDAAVEDTYMLEFKNRGYQSRRAGTLDVYAGIAEVGQTGVKNTEAIGNSWTTKTDSSQTAITWNTRPKISGLTLVKENVSTSDYAVSAMDITDVLAGQTAGSSVTLALIGDWNTKGTNENNNGIEGNYEQVKLTRTTYAKAERVAPEAEKGITKDAVGFKHEFTVSDETVSALTWRVTYNGNTETVIGNIPTITNGSCVVGLLITDLPEIVTPESISASVSIQ